VTKDKMMRECKRFVQDDGGNNSAPYWYLIPTEDYGLFSIMLENCNSGVCTDIDFIDRRDKYRCDHPSCYSVEVISE